MEIINYMENVILAMPTLRQSLVASCTRRYPFFSGCGTFANKPMLNRLAGPSSEEVWSDVPGGVMLSPLDDYVGKAAYYVGDLDRKITWICRQLVERGDTVLDIGANLGLVTVALSDLVGEEGRVFSFEPNPRIQALLNQTVEKNDANNVTVFPVALGEEKGELELWVPSENAGEGSLVRHNRTDDGTTHKVKVETLSEITEKAGIENVRLIKIDVEGFEENVFRGAAEFFAKAKPEAILFELNEVKGHLKDEPVIQLLQEYGYGFFSIPRCFVNMRLERFDPETDPAPEGHDFVAAPLGTTYEEVAAKLNA